MQFAMFGVGSDLRGLLHGARCAEAAVADDDAARVHHATDEGMRWAAFRNRYRLRRRRAAGGQAPLGLCGGKLSDMTGAARVWLITKSFPPPRMS